MILGIDKIFFIIVAVALMVMVRPVSAQSPATEAKTSVYNPAARKRSDTKTEADRIANERRVEARLLLISLASDARSFRDSKLRARSLARIADVLWTVEVGGSLFYRLRCVGFAQKVESTDAVGGILDLTYRTPQLMNNPTDTVGGASYPAWSPKEKVADSKGMCLAVFASAFGWARRGLLDFVHLFNVGKFCDFLLMKTCI